jgi:hypothetical protein
MWIVLLQAEIRRSLQSNAKRKRENVFDRQRRRYRIQLLQQNVNALKKVSRQDYGLFVNNERHQAAKTIQRVWRSKRILPKKIRKPNNLQDIDDLVFLKESIEFFTRPDLHLGMVKDFKLLNHAVPDPEALQDLSRRKEWYNTVTL